MQLVSYNIQYSKGRDGRYDLGRIAAALEGGDVIALQEVERNWPRTAMADQPAKLGALLPGYYWVYGPAFDMDASEAGAGSAVVNRRRQFGNMLLARWPITWSRLHTLPKLATVEQFNMDMTALECVIEAPGGPLRVLSIHLGSISSRERLMQIALLLDLHDRATATGGAWCGEPVVRGNDSWAVGEPPAMPREAIWMGDFNAQPDGPEYAAIVGPDDPLYGDVRYADRFADAWTAAGNERDDRVSYPANEDMDDMQLDYCFVSAGLADRVRASRIDMDAAGSDHQPVWVEIDL